MSFITHFRKKLTFCFVTLILGILHEINLGSGQYSYLPACFEIGNWLKFKSFMAKNQIFLAKLKNAFLKISHYSF